MIRDLFGVEVPDQPPRHKTDLAHPAPPGTGPAGKTCKTCASLCYCPQYRRRFYKCRLVRMTNGPATDIRLKTPACRHYSQQEATA